MAASLRHPGSRARRLLAPLGIAVAGLAGRSAVDKLLALRAGAGGVVAWGQMASLLDLVTGVVAAGIGSGLAVLVAGAEPPRRAALLRSALRLGGALSALVAALLCAVAAWRAPWAAALGLPRDDLVLGGVAGVAISLGSLAGSYWLGAQRLRLQGLLALLAAALATLVAGLAPPGRAVQLLAGAQALLSLGVAAWTLRVAPAGPGGERGARAQLLRYLPAGLALGVLGPASMLAARALTAQGLSWQAAGTLQALWRVSDWVTSIAASVLSVLYLPRLGRAWAAPGAARNGLANCARRPGPCCPPARWPCSGCCGCACRCSRRCTARALCPVRGRRRCSSAEACCAWPPGCPCSRCMRRAGGVPSRWGSSRRCPCSRFCWPRAQPARGWPGSPRPGC